MSAVLHSSSHLINTHGYQLTTEFLALQCIWRTALGADGRQIERRRAGKTWLR
jgi:hypothetical protein